MVTQLCGINSAVECQLPKLKVASSNLVSRSRFQVVEAPRPPAEGINRRLVASVLGRHAGERSGITKLGFLAERRGR